MTQIIITRIKASGEKEEYIIEEETTEIQLNYTGVKCVQYLSYNYAEKELFLLLIKCIIY